MELFKKALSKEYINRIYITLILFIFLLMILYIYRPYIYTTNINDFSLANSLPNLFYTIIIIQISFIYDSIKKAECNNKLQIVAITLGVILAEIFQKLTNIGTFDLIDIIYITMGIPVGFLIEGAFEGFIN